MSHDMTFGGTVVSVNTHSFKLKTELGEQSITLSKWNDVGGQLPPVGALVSVRVDDKGYCRAWTLAQPIAGASEAPRPAEQEAPRGALPSRDVAITRMAALNTATAILSSGGRTCEAKDVVALAAKLEGWVNR